MARTAAPNPRSTALWLAVLLLAALSVRLIWGHLQPADAETLNRLPDQREYLELGRHLLEDRELYLLDPRFESQPVFAYRTPGYPAFVALCGASVPMIRVAQAMLDTTTVLAAYLLARRWLSPQTSLLAASFVAINPFLIYFQALVLSETLFTALLAWSLVLLVRRWTWACFVVLTAAVLVRPSALFLPVLIALASGTVNRSRYGPYQLTAALRTVLLAAALLTLALLPWAWRNHRLLGAWVWTTTNGGITRYDGFNPQATGASDQSFVARLPQLQEMGEVERNQYLSHQAADYQWRHPLDTARLALTKIARTWSLIPLSREYGSQWIYVTTGLLFTVPFDLLIIIGLLGRRLPASAKLLLLLPALYLTAIHAFSVGSLRYRIPAEPPLAVLAAAAIRPRRT